ncbi:MAG: hypothetical protein ACD_76C00009G0003 [uncultured bacterium]|nr:MAG: hypothetical protein ACD_76C00009G0003 [uncultured bacterium]HBD04848.1 hypothetical protein [Candidatus Uhrbacteria bacterium]
MNTHLDRYEIAELLDKILFETCGIGPESEMLSIALTIDQGVRGADIRELGQRIEAEIGLRNAHMALLGLISQRGQGFTRDDLVDYICRNMAIECLNPRL